METSSYKDTIAPDRFVVTHEEKNMAVFTHLAALSGVVIPFGHIIGPLVLWLAKRNDMPFVDDQGKEALNFQITMTIAMVVAALLIFLLIGIVLLPVVMIYWLVVVVIAAVRTAEGRHYQYPTTIRFIS